MQPWNWVFVAGDSAQKDDGPLAQPRWTKTKTKQTLTPSFSRNVASRILTLSDNFYNFMGWMFSEKVEEFPFWCAGEIEKIFFREVKCPIWMPWISFLVWRDPDPFFIEPFDALSMNLFSLTSLFGRRFFEIEIFGINGLLVNEFVLFGSKFPQPISQSSPFTIISKLFDIYRWTHHHAQSLNV